MPLNPARVTGWVAGLTEKGGTIGSLVSAMGCAMCFPPLASIGAAVGLGFLAQWEGLLVNTLLPVFTWIVLIGHATLWLAHRQWHRSLAGIIGPAVVLLSLYPWWQYGWSTWTLYGGLALMVLVALWNMVSPAPRACRVQPQEPLGHRDDPATGTGSGR